jgi:chemotaxis methyl-accepting protein methylase
MEEFYIISESGEKSLTKTQIRKIVRDEISKELKKANMMNKEDVRKIVKDMMVKQQKFFWEKKSFWVNNI